MSSQPTAAGGAVPINGSPSCRQIAAQLPDNPVLDNPVLKTPALDNTARPFCDGLLLRVALL